MLIYIAGPYRAKYGRSVTENIAAAKKVAIECWQHGHYAVAPHLNTAHFEDDAPEIPDEVWLAGTMAMQARCDAILMLETWQDSEGAIAEHDYAQQVGQPIYYYPDIPGESLTEKRCPQQCKAFLDMVMSMYRLHLSKNADYSPANMLGTGEIGLITRLWDKIARLLNLYGWDIEIVKSVHTAPRQPKHESINDTLIDSAVYAVIGLLLRQGKWGN